jgi:deazaflavin-dependent oxidoreductase (nitroreductase family)
MSNSKEKKPIPRPGSVEYKFLFGTDEEKKRILKNWKLMNKLFTIPFYKVGIIPITPLRKVFLLLYTKGRKTGKKRITPLEYRRKNGIIHVVAGRGKKAHWFKNLTANPDSLKIQVGFRKFEATHKILESVSDKVDLLQWYVKKFPRDAKFLFGWDPKFDDPEKTDLSHFASLIEIIQFHPKT